MPCDPIDIEMLAVAHRTYLRTPACSRQLIEDYIDWLTAQIAAGVADDSGIARPLLPPPVEPAHYTPPLTPPTRRRE
jgi:hypothetical protein